MVLQICASVMCIFVFFCIRYQLVQIIRHSCIRLSLQCDWDLIMENLKYIGDSLCHAYRIWVSPLLLWQNTVHPTPLYIIVCQYQLCLAFQQVIV